MVHINGKVSSADFGCGLSVLASSRSGGRLPLASLFWLQVALLISAASALAQNFPPQPPSTLDWRASGAAAPPATPVAGAGRVVGATFSNASLGRPGVSPGSPATIMPVAATQAAAPPAAAKAGPRQPIARVTKGSGTLPNNHGQVWREYDITPYTSRVTSTAKPERAIVDWILRETGTEAWFSEPLGLLSANKKALRVYHTQEMQDIVSAIVDRFVASSGQAQTYGIRLVTVRSPNWRAAALPLMRPVRVHTPGVEAWLLTKENAALVADQLRRRTDFREYNSSAVVIQNGQAGAISLLRPRSFMKSVHFRPGTWPGYEVETGQVEQGFSLELSPLLSLDSQTIDAVVKCHVDQIEKMLPVSVDVPNGQQQSQRVQIEVPQMVSWRLHERFLWPADEVLLISAGVVATPAGGKATTAFDLPNPFQLTPPRADGLMFVESKGQSTQAQGAAVPSVATGGLDYRGRY